MKHMRDGRMSVVCYVPFDSVDDALPLRSSLGLLLEAKVSAVTRKMP